MKISKKIADEIDNLQNMQLNKNNANMTNYCIGKLIPDVTKHINHGIVAMQIE